MCGNFAMGNYSERRQKSIHYDNHNFELVYYLFLPSYVIIVINPIK